MNIFLICSRACYKHIPAIQAALERAGHTITLPNCYDDIGTEDRYKQQGATEHAAWKRSMFEQSAEKIAALDAVLVLNFEKNGTPNYIGGATFLEMYDAFRLGKKIFLFNPIPEGILADEIAGFEPTVIHGDLALVR